MSALAGPGIGPAVQPAEGSQRAPATIAVAVPRLQQRQRSARLSGIPTRRRPGGSDLIEGFVHGVRDSTSIVAQVSQSLRRGTAAGEHTAITPDGVVTRNQLTAAYNRKATTCMERRLIGAACGEMKLSDARVLSSVVVACICQV